MKRIETRASRIEQAELATPEPAAKSQLPLR
jgi:hypothetical protein